MPIEVIDVLKAGVTFTGIRLLPSDDAVRRFREATDEEAFRENQSDDDGDPLTVIKLERERTTITQKDDITWFEREYPEKSDLADLAGLAAVCLGDDEVGDRKPAAIGYQLHFLCEQESGLPAARYLAERVLNSAIVEEDWEFFECSSTFSYRDDNGAWRFTLQPRFFSESTLRLFTRVELYHLHLDDSPSRQEMEAGLSLAWAQALALLGRLDEGAVKA